MGRASEPEPRQIVPRPEGAVLDPPSGWDLGSGLVLEEAVRRLRRLELPRWPLVSASVLVGLCEQEGRLSVLLTRRAQGLAYHASEIAFPGGHAEEGESPEAAALREAAEEVGLDPSMVEVIGRLSSVTTGSSGEVLGPILGRLRPGFALSPSPDEVEAVLIVPLAQLASLDCHWSEQWVRPASAPRKMHFFRIGSDLVWGATAAILAELLDRLAPPRL